MHLDERIDLLVQLGTYMSGNDEGWQAAQRTAFGDNKWFIPEFVQLSISTIVQNFLQHDALKKLATTYVVAGELEHPKKVGIVLAGNIPLVGFHDVVCTFMSGHKAIIKPSSKDKALLEHLVKKLTEWNPKAADYLQTSELLKGCDAYIATGGNNTGRYFEFYFRKYPSIIRKSRTSVAVLTGDETVAELEALADDVHQYFGLGCRNVTQLLVPQGYNFVPLLEAFRKYSWFSNHHKYKNNYDYNLALHILNNRYYMTNGSILVVEDASPFSPISQLHYQYYADKNAAEQDLLNNDSIQCVVGTDLPFGTAQRPGLTDFADGVDTMAFLKSLEG
jgi:hypothetical protein